jgi:DNA-binding NarL/FixJ family response regulator
MKAAPVVVVSSDLFHRRHIADILNKHGTEALCASTLRECYDVLARQPVGLVFCDRDLTDGNYKDLLEAYRLGTFRPKVVVASPDLERDDVKQGMELGAFQVISSPCCSTDVEWMLIQAGRDARNPAEPAFRTLLGGLKLTRTAMASES